MTEHKSKFLNNSTNILYSLDAPSPQAHHHSGKDAELADPVDLADCVLFLHVNAELGIMPSEVGERAVGAGFMQFYSALSERRQEGQHIVLRFESRRLRTCWRQFAERSFLRL